MVRDCWANEFGYPVFASNGSRTDLCFERRKGLEPTQVKLFKPNQCILWRKNQAISNQKFLKSLFPKLSIISTEEMFLFQYSDKSSDFRTSVSQWKNFLEPLFPESAILHLEESIENMLFEQQNTRPAPPPNMDNLYNKDFVIKQQKLPGSLISDYLTDP